MTIRLNKVACLFGSRLLAYPEKNSHVATGFAFGMNRLCGLYFALSPLRATSCTSRNVAVWVRKFSNRRHKKHLERSGFRWQPQHRATQEAFGLQRFIGRPGVGDRGNAPLI